MGHPLFVVGNRRYEIGVFGRDRPPGETLIFRDLGSVRRALRPLLSSERGLTVLRDALAGTALFMNPGRLARHEVLDACAREIVHQSLWLIVGPPAQREGTPLGPAGEAPPAPVPESGPETRGPRVTHRLHPTSWIQIELYGEDGEPIPRERYRITLPDGHVSRGRLDGNGRARVDPLEPGTCYVTFPDLDEEAWEVR
jgi:hypothetical protein